MSACSTGRYALFFQASQKHAQGLIRKRVKSYIIYQKISPIRSLPEAHERAQRVCALILYDVSRFTTLSRPATLTFTGESMVGFPGIAKTRTRARWKARQKLHQLSKNRANSFIARGVVARQTSCARFPSLRLRYTPRSLAPSSSRRVCILGFAHAPGASSIIQQKSSV